MQLCEGGFWVWISCPWGSPPQVHRGWPENTTRYWPQIALSCASSRDTVDPVHLKRHISGSCGGFHSLVILQAGLDPVILQLLGRLVQDELGTISNRFKQSVPHLSISTYTNLIKPIQTAVSYHINNQFYLYFHTTTLITSYVIIYFDNI